MAAIKAAVFDFDGTLSTLRAGWEGIMKPFMKQSIVGGCKLSGRQEEELDREIDAYIDRSTGVQTIHQMRWLADTVRAKGWNGVVADEWAYKAEYNDRLLARVRERTARLGRGEAPAEQFLIRGSAAFLQQLRARGVRLFLASGTDHPDVVREAVALGLSGFFEEIHGAPLGKADCAKEKVLADLLHAKGFRGEELAVIGDGKVEIRLGKEAGGLALGLASDEERREGIDPVKARRLESAGADWIAGDYGNADEWLRRMGW